MNVARPEDLAKVVIPTNRQDHLSLSLDKNRDVDQSQRPKIRGLIEAMFPKEMSRTFGCGGQLGSRER